WQLSARRGRGGWCATLCPTPRSTWTRPLERDRRLVPRLPSVVPDPWVDEAVEQVDYQVGDDVERGRVDDQRDHHGQVAVEQRGEAVTAQARDVEHELGEEGAV